jgi:hypothetical protein
MRHLEASYVIRLQQSSQTILSQQPGSLGNSCLVLKAFSNSDNLCLFNRHRSSLAFAFSVAQCVSQQQYDPPVVMWARLANFLTQS